MVVMVIITIIILIITVPKNLKLNRNNEASTQVNKI